MGKKFTELSGQHIEFIQNQKMYFVATAAKTGNVNLSPKGGDTFRVINPQTVAWMNLTGSGNETAAHIIQNSRMTIMFCAFQGKPMILRLYGKAKVIHRKDPEWSNYINLFPETVASRQIFILDIDIVQTSCGMGVPYFNYKGDRDQLTNWSTKVGRGGIENYWYDKNQKSIDGFETEIVERTGIGNLASNE